jgi:hypothetical protein
MPRAHAGVLSGAALTLALAVAGVSAEERATATRPAGPGPIARAASVHATTVTLELTRRPAQRTTSDRRRGPGRIVAGAAVGAVGGFFAGGYLGAWIDGDCGGCDDPGLKGALIGAPIGAVTGGILGGKFLF